MAEQFGNLVDLCDRSCERYADRPLFGTKHDGKWQWTTYGEFRDLVAAFRGGLASIGVGPGDQVAMVADNRIEWAVACYATYGLGAAYVPMYQAQLAKEWQFIIGDCGASVAIGANAAIVDKLEHIRQEVPTLKHVVGLDLPGSDPRSYAALVEAGRARPVAPRFPAASDLAGLIYTSGTTGMPKGVMLSHGNIASNINAIQEVFTFDPDDRSLAFLPWAHSFGQTCELHGLLSMGCSIAINDEIPNLLANLAEVKPTILFAVPRIFNRLYNGVSKQMSERPAVIQSLFQAGIRHATRKSRGESLGLLDSLVLTIADRLVFAKVRERFGGRLRYAISGSAALNQEVAEFIDALGIMVYEGYGLTETSPISTANYPGHRKLGSVGRAIPHVRIAIDCQVTGDPTHGEILVYGPNVMQGYHNRPEENAAVLMPDGGFRTGDMGYLDDDGYLYITGRIKEQYKLENGKYVVPTPIEEQIKLSPFIANILVHGANKPHNVAVVVLDRESLKPWAASQGVDLEAAPQHDKVRDLITRELESHSHGIKGFEKVRDFILTDEDFTTENGMLTPTLKLKRRVVLERYGDAIEQLYENAPPSDRD